MAMNPLQVANIMAQAAQAKAGQPNDGSQGAGPANPKSKRVAAAKEQEKAKGKKPPQTKKPMPPQGGAAPQGGMPPQGM